MSVKPKLNKNLIQKKMKSSREDFFELRERELFTNPLPYGEAVEMEKQDGN